MASGDEAAAAFDERRRAAGLAPWLPVERACGAGFEEREVPGGISAGWKLKQGSACAVEALCRSVGYACCTGAGGGIYPGARVEVEVAEPDSAC